MIAGAPWPLLLLSPSPASTGQSGAAGAVGATWPLMFFSPAAPPTLVLDLRAALRSYLLNDTALVAMVGDRIRPGGFDESDPLPAITYRVITDTRGHHLRGADGVSVARVQFDCWSRDLADCVAAKSRLELLLDGWSDRRAAFGREVLRAKQELETDLHEPPDDATPDWLFHVAVDYRIKHRVLIPTFA